jgi:hypothetical protein
MTPAQIQALKKVINYLADEEEHFENSARSCNHIWLSISILIELVTEPAGARKIQSFDLATAKPEGSA